MKSKVSPQELGHLIGYVKNTYQQLKGSPYPFSNKAGRIIKDCILIYTAHGAKALWDVFLKTNKPWVGKDGYTVRPSFEMDVFRAKWTILVDDPEYKTLFNKYQGTISQQTLDLISGLNAPEMPGRENGQMNKVKAIRDMDNFNG